MYAKIPVTTDPLASDDHVQMAAWK